MVTYGSHVMVTWFVLSCELVCTARGDTMLLVVDYTPRASPRTALGSNGHLCVVTERIVGVCPNVECQTLFLLSLHNAYPHTRSPTGGGELVRLEKSVCYEGSAEKG